MINFRIHSSQVCYDILFRRLYMLAIRAYVQRRILFFTPSNMDFSILTIACHCSSHLISCPSPFCEDTLADTELD